MQATLQRVQPFRGSCKVNCRSQRRTDAVRAQLQQNLVGKIVQGAGLSLASFSLALAAQAGVTVKMGADSGALVFVPDTVTIKSGDTVTWVNNAGYPHNIDFDEDDVPSGVDVSIISHEDLMNAPGESYTATFSKAGTYGYHCDPHEGAGMVGKVIVQ